MARLAVALLALVVLAGCGGGDKHKPRTGKDAPTATASPAGETPAAAPKPVSRDEEETIRGWADALRHGDVDRAARYWAVPAVAANGTSPIRLDREGVRLFNQLLPCGARLESVAREGGYVVATFVLTERPGRGRCGAGTGRRARTAFVIRHRKIEQWLRAPDPAQPSGQSS